MIRFHHVYKTYPGPVHALRDISFEVGKGELVYVSGPSGAGKSTLFRLICAFDRPQSGSIQIGHFNLNTLSAGQIPFHRRRLGVVFQDFKLLKDRTVFENIALPLQIMGEPKTQVRRRVDEALEQVGLRFREDALPEQLSGGEQQRIAIARALIHRPNLLIADEPTGNLDHELSREIMNLFKQANAQGTTVLIATHDFSLIDSSKYRVLKLKGGALVESAGREASFDSAAL
jgi:cell division transport system ATP-binding protein